MESIEPPIDKSDPKPEDDKSDPKLKEWNKILYSEKWKVPPNWTRASSKKTGFWDRIKKVPSKIYEFLVVRISYEDYFASQLQSRYMDIEGNFRTTLEKKDENSYIFIKELLILSKEILEQEKFGKKDLLTVSSLLDEAEERMIWILPPDIKMAKIRELDYQLDILPKHKEDYKKLLNECSSHPINSKDGVDLQENNASIEEIIRAVNKTILAKRINTGLQIERLRSLRFWGLILLILFVLLFPIAGRPDIWPPYDQIMGFWDDLTKNASSSHSWFMNYGQKIPVEIFGGWAVALGFCIIGGIGGFLSGLLQVRTSETNLELYEEAVLLFQIRPIFGAFAALVIFMLMSWGAFDSVLSESLSRGNGVYALAAFLSGFSERYFLKLLKLEPESKELKETEAPKETEELKETSKRA